MLWGANPNPTLRPSVSTQAGTGVPKRRMPKWWRAGRLAGRVRVWVRVRVRVRVRGRVSWPVRTWPVGEGPPEVEVLRSAGAGRCVRSVCPGRTDPAPWGWRRRHLALVYLQRSRQRRSDAEGSPQVRPGSGAEQREARSEATSARSRRVGRRSARPVAGRPPRLRLRRPG